MPDNVGDLRSKVITFLAQNANLSKEQKAKLATMTNEELLALKETFSSKMDEVDTSQLMFKPEATTNIPVESYSAQKSFWNKPAGRIIKGVGGVALAGLGVAAMFSNPIGLAAGATAISAQGFLGLLGTTAGVGLFLSSCDNLFQKPEPTTVNFYNYNKNLNNFILKYEQEGNDEIVALLKELLEKLTSIETQINEANGHLEGLEDKVQLLTDAINLLLDENTTSHTSILDYLNKILDAIESGNNLSGAILDNLLEVINQLHNMEATNAAGFNNIMNQLDQMGETQQQQFWTLMETLTGMGVNISTLLSGIGNDLSNAINMLQSILTTLQKIKDKLGQLDAHMQAGFDAMLAQILQSGGNITTAINNLSTMLEQNLQTNTQLLKDILEAIGNLHGSMQAGYSALLAQILQSGGDITAALEQLKQMMEHQTQLLRDIIAAIGNLQGSVQAGYSALLLQIQQSGGDITAALQDLKELLLHHSESLQEILNAIHGLDANMQVGFMSIISKILQAGGDITAAINDLKALMQQNNALLTQIYNKLNELDAHMQAGFNAMIAQMIANGSDLSAIVTKLNQLAALLQSNNDLLQQIFNKLDGLDANVQAGFLSMLAQIQATGGDISGQLQNLYNAVCNITPAVIDAINNIVIQPGSVSVNVNLDPVVQAINNMNANMNTHCAAIYAMLSQISGQLTTTQQKLDAIHTIAVAIYNKIGDGFDNISVHLQQIINNQFCQDDSCCDQIIEYLQLIVEWLSTHSNNEGFDGGLYDPLFG